MSRKTYLTDALAKRIVRLVRAGNALSVAAEACNVPRQTASDWYRWGKEGKEAFSAFSDAVMSAEAAVEVEMVKIVRSAARGEKTKKVKKIYKQGEVEGELVLIEESEEVSTKKYYGAAIAWLKLRRPDRWRDTEMDGEGTPIDPGGEGYTPLFDDGSEDPSKK